MIAAIALLLAGSALVPSVATASASAVAADAELVPFSLSFAASPAEGVDPGGCEAAFGSVGTHECNGTFTDPDGTEPFISTTDLPTGSASWTRADGTDTADLSITTIGGELYGTYDTTDPTSLTVTSGLAAWTTGMTTLDDGSAPGQPGGPLQLAITSTCTNPTTECTATITLTGYVHADPPTSSPNAEWVTFDLYLDATSGFSSGCDGTYLQVNLECVGTYQGHAGSTPTRYPFDSGPGTVIAIPPIPKLGYGRVNFFVSGAQLSGRIPDATSSRLEAHEILVPWGTGVHSGNSAAIAAGLQGGPLYLDVTWHPSVPLDPYQKYTFHVSGWVLRSPTFEVGPDLPDPPDSPAVSTPTSATAATPIGPRFAG